MGDFNALPGSPVYNTLQESGFGDAFAVSGAALPVYGRA